MHEHGELWAQIKKGLLRNISRVEVSADMVFADASIIRDKAIYSRPHGVKHHTARVAIQQIFEPPKPFQHI